MAVEVKLDVDFNEGTAQERFNGIIEGCVDYMKDGVLHNAWPAGAIALSADRLVTGCGEHGVVSLEPISPEAGVYRMVKIGRFDYEEWPIVEVLSGIAMVQGDKIDYITDAPQAAGSRTALYDEFHEGWLLTRLGLSAPERPRGFALKLPDSVELSGDVVLPTIL